MMKTSKKQPLVPACLCAMGVGAVNGHLAASAAVSAGAPVGTEAFSANVEADAAARPKPSSRN
jgi:hypothetical protein